MIKRLTGTTMSSLTPCTDRVQNYKEKESNRQEHAPHKSPITTGATNGQRGDTVTGNKAPNSQGPGRNTMHNTGTP